MTAFGLRNGSTPAFFVISAKRYAAARVVEACSDAKRRRLEEIMRTKLSLWRTGVPLLLALICLAAQPAQPPGDDKWEKEIAAFEEADQNDPPPPDGVLFVGSSSIRLWKTLSGDFAKASVINRGFGGSEMADSVRYADRIILPYQPAMIFVYAGDNDLANNKTPEQVLADFKALVAKVHAKLPKTKIYFISIKPSKARWKLIDRIRKANDLVKAYAAGGGEVGYVDVFTPMLNAQGMPRDDLLVEDGLHMNRAGYALWAQIIRPLLP